MACLMAEALDVAAENFLKLTKYEKLTALSKTLRDDPSCQLCSILLKYMIRGNLADIESNLDLKGVPPLTTLRQGIVVLSRQWKNALYTPILIEYNLRCRSLKNIYGTQMNLEPVDEEAYGGEDEDDDEEEEESDEEDEDAGAEFGEEALLLKNPLSGPKFTLKNGSIVSELSASIKAKFSPAHFSPLSDELVLLERNSAGQQHQHQQHTNHPYTQQATRMFDQRASVISGESNDGIMHSVAPSEMLVSQS